MTQTVRVFREIPLYVLEDVAAKASLLRYGANTCWWGMDDAPWYNTSPDGEGLPCDPRGGMLFQTDKPLDFIQAAKQEVESKGPSSVYGKHGLRTFLLAYHGCVVTQVSGKPTCFRTWDEYSALIDDWRSTHAQ